MSLGQSGQLRQAGNGENQGGERRVLSTPLIGREGPTQLRSGTAGANASGGLDWLWARFRDNPNPHVLDCGPIQNPTVNVLAERGSRLYVADLVSAVRLGDGELWDRTGEAPVFRTDRLLSELPSIPPGSLSIVFCWQLLDVLPREALPNVIRRMYLYLEPDGVLFFILREPYLTTGSDTMWYLETLTKVAARNMGQTPFSYPPVSNREMERLIPAGIAKTVLTRSGVREVLAVK
jgi:hypothetical protein